MNPTAKLFIVAGLVLIAVGVVWQFGGKYLQFLGRLPGDIAVEKEGFRFYFPIVTCIVISVVGSLILYVIRMFRG
ncbi:DUF2905 domain-containing protein [Paenibacillus sp.]|uniref:DUF2905 domain-containing protein n=1 Tax=Paenibacillus sp. TaxID=58172 RepID=UPI002D5FE69A|nr:DUF2905 domain-containing protein [Paenibacillus sp.]HZG57656.1 DUF2905 domain-containing protein [Paenibacillus sp.]